MKTQPTKALSKGRVRPKVSKWEKAPEGSDDRTISLKDAMKRMAEKK